MNVRRCVAVALLFLMAVEVLPCSWLEVPMTAGGGLAGSACRFESLKVCDTGDSLLGGLATDAFLFPAAPAIVKVSRLLGFIPEDPAVTLEGFPPGVDRPPKRSA